MFILYDIKISVSILKNNIKKTIILKTDFTKSIFKNTK
jgi:hypothetical protein